ncbi:MAG: hypothetical protein ACE5G9_10250 [Nitrospinales bacterium]
MKLELYEKPREFKQKTATTRDYGKIRLEENEMISFKTPSGRENDVTAYSWGLYIAPSVNNRLKNEGFKTALVLNEQGRIFINIVELDKVEEFRRYLKTGQNSVFLTWLDEWGEPE